MIREYYRFIWKVSGRRQLALSAMAIALFLLELVPLELQRRIVNGAVDHREFSYIGLLCLAYVGISLTHGGLKLVLNVFSASVGESVNRRLRLAINPAAAPGPAQGQAPPRTHHQAHKAEGVAISIIVSEVDTVGNFVATSFSGPLLNAGILVSVLGYMIFTQPWLALVAFLVFSPQLLFIVPLQAGINRHTTSRIVTLRELSVEIVEHAARPAAGQSRDGFLRRIGEVYRLSMKIFRRKYGMNFLMKHSYHLGVIGILATGSWL
ncbi:MAG: ABC transporter ATP-binding protein, partial [Betaproteobacteria bacterium]|nr:ABC transporter ATP-binding protein [Betaproteobacteria bacterium]